MHNGNTNMNKEEISELRKAAMRLPVVYDRVKGTQMMTMAEMNDAGVKFEIPAEDREAILENPDHRFAVDIEYRVKRNHFRRMRNAFNKGGAAHVVNYINSVYALARAGK